MARRVSSLRCREMVRFRGAADAVGLRPATPALDPNRSRVMRPIRSRNFSYDAAEADKKALAKDLSRCRACGCVNLAPQLWVDLDGTDLNIWGLSRVHRSAHGATPLLEGLPEALISLVPDSALSGD